MGKRRLLFDRGGLMDRISAHFLLLAVLILSMQAVSGAPRAVPVSFRGIRLESRESENQAIRLSGDRYIAAEGRAALAGLVLDKAGI